MRRGLLAWSREEVPEAVLEARLERCRRAMAEDGLDGLVVYTSFPRPAAVSWLTHFVPYWSQGILVVLPDGLPVLIVSLSKRVGGWIASTARIGDIISTPAPGRAAAELFAQRAPAAKRIGVIELDALPAGIAGDLADGLTRTELVDASGMFARIRDPADEAEIALTTRAAGIARTALDQALHAPVAGSGKLVSAIEGQARAMGAEEVLIRVAPDLAAGASLRRLEGEPALGVRFAIQVSAVYKGHWARLTRSVARDGVTPAGWAEAESAFGAALAALAPDVALAGVAADAAARVPGARLAAWTVEGTTGTRPLAALAAAGHPGPMGREPPAGAVRTLGLRLDLPGGPWIACDTVAVASAPGTAGRRLSDA